MLDRRHLLVVALAIAGATAGLFVGRMLRPDPRAALAAASVDQISPSTPHT